jgi:aspartate 1-decarboxylase
MLINLLKSKIHRAIVTEANLDYIGSISIDEGLMEAANISEFEAVHVLNVSNGERLITYAIKAPRNSGGICINGAAAHLAKKGDLVIIVAYCLIEDDKTMPYKPTMIHVDENNQILK